MPSGDRGRWRRGRAGLPDAWREERLLELEHCVDAGGLPRRECSRTAAHTAE